MVATPRKKQQRRDWVRVPSQAPDSRRLPIAWSTRDVENLDVEVLLHVVPWGAQNDFLLAALRLGAKQLLEIIASNDADQGRRAAHFRDQILQTIRQTQIAQATLQGNPASASGSEVPIPSLQASTPSSVPTHPPPATPRPAAVIEQSNREIAPAPSGQHKNQVVSAETHQPAPSAATAAASQFLKN